VEAGIDLGGEAVLMKVIQIPEDGIAHTLDMLSILALISVSFALMSCSRSL